MGTNRLVDYWKYNERNPDASLKINQKKSTKDYIIEDLERITSEEISMIYKLIRAFITRQQYILRDVVNRIMKYISKNQ